MSSNDLITNVGINSNDTAALAWSVADDLVGACRTGIFHTGNAEI